MDPRASGTAGAQFGNAIFTPLLVIVGLFILYRCIRGALWYRATHKTGRLILSSLAGGTIVLMLYFTVIVFAH